MGGYLCANGSENVWCVCVFALMFARESVRVNRECVRESTESGCVCIMS